MITTPWGFADRQTELAPGIISYSTPSHGGIQLSPELNAKVPAHIKAATFNKLGEQGWYEEDVDWAIVAHFFPDAFDDQARMVAEGCIGFFCSMNNITFEQEA